MTTEEPIKGVFAAALTPLRDNMSCDNDMLAAHCAHLIKEGCHGVSLFGTTGEGPAFSAEERMGGLDAVLNAGIPADKILPATGCAALPDTVRLTRHAAGKGCKNVLVMPPFFFKDLSDEGVFRVYAEIAESVGDPALRIYIYNFPAVTGVWVREMVVGKLLNAYPKIFAGVKDSSGDWNYVMALLDLSPNLAVFTGHETLLPKLLTAGGKGNISGMANLIPGLLRRLYDERPVKAADPLFACVAALVDELSKHPITPAIKALAANLRHSPSWRKMRPPLVAIEPESEKALLAAFVHGLQGVQLEAETGM